MQPGRLFLVLFWLVACTGTARADWLWLDDTWPAAPRIEANGFTLAPLLVAGEALTDGTYDNRDRVLPGVTSVSFAGTFSLHNSPASSFAWTLFFLPPGGGPAPSAELVMTGEPADGGEHVAGTFLGKGDPALPEAIAAGAASIIVDPDFTFPFHTQNLSMLVSVARADEPEGIGLLAIGLTAVALRRRARHPSAPP